MSVAAGKRFTYGRDDGGRPRVGDRVMALVSIEGTVGSDAADLLLGWDLIEQHRRIAHVAGGELRRT